MKNAGAIGWSEVETGEAALIARCTRGDETACAELVAAHQRMVYGLAFNLLGNRMTPWTCRRTNSSGCSERCQVFKASRRFARGSIASWSTRHATVNGGGGGGTGRSESRWMTLRNFGDLEARQDILPDRLLVSKETAAKILAGDGLAAIRAAHVR